MKTTDYREGDVVILNDGKRYKYLGGVVVAGEVSNAYKPLDGKTEYATIKKTPRANSLHSMAS